MIRFIALDSTPLSLFTQRRGVPLADACKRWLNTHSASGMQIIIPEIVDYELRRELLRLGRTASINRLDRLLANPSIRYEPLTTRAIRLAAEMWRRLDVTARQPPTRMHWMSMLSSQPRYSRQALTRQSVLWPRQT